MVPNAAAGHRPGHRSRRPSRGATFLQTAWTRTLVSLRRFGRRRARAAAWFALAGLAGSVIVGLLAGPPLPSVHDEFSYLLASDTFSQGRLTNPPHPFWRHFETFHVLQQPTYASKYPPGQGLILGLGQALFGHPAMGVWLSIGLATGAIAWMLLIWLPAAWGVLASVFFTVQVGWVSYWAQSYWGGAVAALGGALAIGAARALWKEPKIGYGLVLGTGLGVLASSRPFEGALLGSLLAGLLGFKLWRGEPRERRLLVRRGLLPALLVAVVWFGSLAYYNQQVTGSALRMPYQSYEDQYAAAPSFLFQETGPERSYTHPEFDVFWNELVRNEHEAQRQPRVFATSAASKLLTQLFFFLGPGILALVALPRILARRWIAYAVLIVGCLAGVTLFTKQGYPHYVAPATGAFYIVLGGSLASLHRSARRNAKADLSLLVVLALFAYLPFMAQKIISSLNDQFAYERAAMVRSLERHPGKDLVIVRYAENHNVLHEWVYNEADIEKSEVVWARSMGIDESRRLIEHFADRNIWILTVGEGARLAPFREAISDSEPAASSRGGGNLPP